MATQRDGAPPQQQLPLLANQPQRTRVDAIPSMVAANVAKAKVGLAHQLEVGAKNRIKW